MTVPNPPSERSERQNRTHSWVIGLVGTLMYLALLALLWRVLEDYIKPSNATERKDLIQGLGLIMAGVAGAVGIFLTWRSQRHVRENQERSQRNTEAQLLNAQEELRLTRQGQITERFTRAIDQLGSGKLEIRLGGIYTLERIAWDSPERDYSAVMEVLTAYVRENTSQAPGPSKGSSEAASSSNEATAEADEGMEQPAPPDPRRPTADIQAILDVLRRTQDRVPDEYRTSLDLNEAYLRDAHLRDAILQEADLQEANLVASDLELADLARANLLGANLLGTNLVDATGITEDQIEWTVGCNETKLGEGLDRPELWSKSLGEQQQIILERIRGGY